MKGKCLKSFGCGGRIGAKFNRENAADSAAVNSSQTSGLGTRTPYFVPIHPESFRRRSFPSFG